MSMSREQPKVHDHGTIYHRYTNDWFNLYPISCTHLGHICADEQLIAQDVEKLRADPNGIGILMGDLCDSVVYTDKRFDADTVSKWIRQTSQPQELVDLQVEKVTEVFAPVADKLIGILVGNHEETIRKKCNTNITRRIAKQLKVATGHNVPYLGREAFIRLRFSRGKAKDTRSRKAETFTIYAHHGWFTGARMAGGMTNNLSRLFGLSDAQLSIVGHAHKKHSCPPIEFVHVKSRGPIESRIRYAAMTGGYLRKRADEVESYAVGAGYQATLLGYTPIRICPTTGEVVVEIG